jgi:osmoprotectant transport system ATP-binding protein
VGNPDFLRLDDVSKRRDGRLVLDSIRLAVPEGAFVALVGPSGSGKTTLLKTINRLVELDQGSVSLAGEDVRDTPPAALRRRIGYAFQGIGLFPHMDVAENIAIVPRLAGAPPAERTARVAELLDLVALGPEFAARSPRTLSGGQAQRVGLARALAARPSLMLMDEPFGALDPQTRWGMQTLILDILKKQDNTVLFVTHDISEAVFLADVVFVLSHRPARVITRVDVPYFESREAAVKQSAEFKRIENQLLDVLHESKVQGNVRVGL